MPGKVVRVRRRERLGWSERLYLPMIAVALAVAAGTLIRNLFAFARGTRRGFGHTYPEQRPVLPDAFRGQPVLLANAHGQPRCVACGLCAFACPSDCIEVEPSSSNVRMPARFQIDLSRCMFCGLCEEACPEDAIGMSRDFELATDDPKTLQLGLGQLMRTDAQLISPGESET